MSHVNMDTFWSQTDYNTITEIGGAGWLLATVFNKAKNRRSLYYQKGNGFLPCLMVDDISTEVNVTTTARQRNSWDQEFRNKVKIKPSITTSHYNSWLNRVDLSSLPNFKKEAEAEVLNMASSSKENYTKKRKRKKKVLRI